MGYTFKQQKLAVPPDAFFERRPCSPATMRLALPPRLNKHPASAENVGQIGQLFQASGVDPASQTHTEFVRWQWMGFDQELHQNISKLS